jgi:hypothetical protein
MIVVSAGIIVVVIIERWRLAARVCLVGMWTTHTHTNQGRVWNVK